MLYAIVGMLVIIADQYIKFWVQGHIAVNTAEEFIPGILSLANVHNDGAAFGFLAGSGIRLPFIILAAVFAIVVILALATNLISGKLARWSIVLVTAGGLSNCLDRVLYGYVQDMFKLEFINFPVFNLADVFITVFAIIFALAVIFGKTRKDRDEDEDDDFVDDEEEEPAPKRKPKRKSRKARREEEEDEDDDEDEEEPPRPAPKKTAKRSRKRAEEEEVPVPAPKKAAASRSSAKTKPAAPAQEEEDPFAAWERANAKAKAVKDRQSAVVQAASRPTAAPEAPAEPKPAPKPAAKPAPKPAEPKPAPKPAPVTEEYSLDDILNEFK
ncbi:MAG: signal peptidase II [Oscillospiraceae bacterium]|nr:signal peptidase II [Oscillospiraceae bacterium]